MYRCSVCSCRRGLLRHFALEGHRQHELTRLGVRLCCDVITQSISCVYIILFAIPVQSLRRHRFTVASYCTPSRDLVARSSSHSRPPQRQSRLPRIRVQPWWRHTNCGTTASVAQHKQSTTHDCLATWVGDHTRPLSLRRTEHGKRDKPRKTAC